MKTKPSLTSDPACFSDPQCLGGGGSPGAAQCLAALLHGPPGSNLRRAHGVLGQSTLLDLVGQSADELAEVYGLQLAEAVRLEAALGLAGYVRCARQPERPSMQSAQQVYRFFGARLGALQRETLQALLLDGKHRLRRWVTISVGTLTTSLVHPREVFRPAIRSAAAALILVHNHPSGDPEPSLEDIKVTRRILEASSLLGIPLLDHVIIGRGAFSSLRERAALPWTNHPT